MNLPGISRPGLTLTHPVSRSDERFLFGSQLVQQVVGHLHTSGPQLAYRQNQRTVTHNNRKWNMWPADENGGRSGNSSQKSSCKGRKDDIMSPQMQNRTLDVHICYLMSGPVRRWSHRFYNIQQIKTVLRLWCNYIHVQRYFTHRDTTTAHWRKSERPHQCIITQTKGFGIFTDTFNHYFSAHATLGNANQSFTSSKERTK